MKLIIQFLVFSLTLVTLAHAEINLVELEAKLKGEGVTGEIHGANEDSKLFVLTVRNPTDFFDNIQLPLTSDSPEILASLAQIKRHQFYTVKGEFITNKAPIKHINLSSLVLAKDYHSEIDQLAHQYKGNTSELKNMTEFTGRVHAIGEEGKMLVMEYIDRIVPVFVSEPASQNMVKNLYRGDLIKLKYKTRTEPEAPLHLGLQPSSNNPIFVLESLVKSHGSPIEKSGYLIKFPKSPQINTNIYALLVEDIGGTTIQYTLTNFESPVLFKQIREKLEKVWNENLGSIENDRNKLVNRKLLVHGKGISNMVDAGQANPQILINTIDDLAIEVLK